ncbi:hypothetical protein CWI36_3301p0010, partial [Hamiltosporidium magnivora]
MGILDSKIDPIYNFIIRSLAVYRVYEGIVDSEINKYYSCIVSLVKYGISDEGEMSEFKDYFDESGNGLNNIFFLRLLKRLLQNQNIIMAFNEKDIHLEINYLHENTQENAALKHFESYELYLDKTRIIFLLEFCNDNCLKNLFIMLLALSNIKILYLLNILNQTFPIYHFPIQILLILITKILIQNIEIMENSSIISNKYSQLKCDNITYIFSTSFYDIIYRDIIDNYINSKNIIENSEEVVHRNMGFNIAKLEQLLNMKAKKNVLFNLKILGLNFQRCTSEHSIFKSCKILDICNFKINANFVFF